MKSVGKRNNMATCIYSSLNYHLSWGDLRRGLRRIYIYMWFRKGYAPGVCARLCLPRAFQVVSCQQTACAPHMRRGLRQGTPCWPYVCLCVSCPSTGAPPKTSPIATYKKRSAPGSAPYIYMRFLQPACRSAPRSAPYIYIYIYIYAIPKGQRGDPLVGLRDGINARGHIYM